MPNYDQGGGTITPEMRAREEAEAQARAAAVAAQQQQARDLAQARGVDPRTGTSRDIGGPSGAGVYTNPVTIPTDEKDAISAEMEKFYNYMMKPLDMNDPYVKAIMTGVQNKAETAARLRGIQGPMSVANTESMMTNAGAQLDLQKKGVAADILKGLSGRDISLQQLGWEEEAFDLNAKNAMSLQDYQNNQKTAAGWGSIIGGGLGAAAALIPGIGWAAAPALIGLGSGLGGMVGGAIGGGGAPIPQPYTTSTYTPSYRYKSGGGLNSGL